MKILIPADHAVQILRERLAEIEVFGFNSKAWKDKTENDLREIFPASSLQWLQVSQIHFDTPIISEKTKVLAEGKETARQLISSFIDAIIKYSHIAQQIKEIKEKDYEQKYNDLLNGWNELVPEHDELIKKYKEQLISADGLLEELKAKQTEIERIKLETIQIDNISILKLFKLFYNLPILQIATTLSVLITIVVGLFGLGGIYQKNEANNQLYDLKLENTRLKEDKENITKVIYEKETTINKIQSMLDSLNMENKK